MSQNPRSQRKWLRRAVATVIVLESYYTLHRAACHNDWVEEADDEGHYEWGVSRRKYRFGDYPFPSWAETFFQPAAQFDDLIGLGPFPR